MSESEIDFLLFYPKSIRLCHYGKQFKTSHEYFSLKDLLFSCFYFLVSFILSCLKFSNRKSIDIILSDSKRNEDILRRYKNVKIVALPGKISDTNFKVSWIYVYSFFIHLSIEYSSYNYLNSIRFKRKLDYFFHQYCIFLEKQKVVGVNLNADMTFFQRIAILACRRNGISAYLTPHGYPALLNDIDYNQTNYLFIRGIKLVEIINSKFPSFQKKILKCTNKFDDFEFSINGFSMNSILVLSKPTNGSDFSDKIRPYSRQNSLIYLEEIKEVLLSFNITTTTLRLHPSENINWYKKYVDIDFFHLSNNSSLEDISNSDLIIGPTSSFLFDAYYANRNYLIYEPQVNGMDVLNYETYPPFDGSVKDIYVAKSENELVDLIKNQCINSNQIIGDFYF